MLYGFRLRKWDPVPLSSLMLKLSWHLVVLTVSSAWLLVVTRAIPKKMVIHMGDLGDLKVENFRCFT